VPTEAKPFASLSSGLLARKGAARPAMRPQGFGQVGNGLEDLGWDDMGFEPPKAAEAPRDEDHDAFGDDVVEHPRIHPTGLTPVGSPVHDQQAEIVERFADAGRVEDTADEQDLDGTAEIFEPEAEEEETPARSPVLTKPTAFVKAAVAVAAPITEPVPAPIAAPEFVSAPRHAPSPRSAAGTKAKAAFTLRLDPNRHLKLRLACAVDGRSAQQLVTDALDQLLERMPDLDGLAAKAKRRG
jgi:hypothetical protein